MLSEEHDQPHSSSSEDTGGAIRLDPQGFPHPPRAGANHLPSTIENVEYLMHSTGFTARFNVIKKRLEVRRRDGAVATMNELVSIAMLNGMNTGWIPPFVGEIGSRTPYNPIQEWILSRPWDGTDRLHAMYDTVQVSNDYPEHLKEKLLYRWLLGVTAAGVKDGAVPIHGVLTLQGDQGVGKTTWIGKLLPPSLRNDYTKLDQHLDGANKDSIIGCITHFIVEIGELDSSFKKDVARLKGFLTNDCDKLRRPYAREEAEYPRKTVFAATVNEERFLVDNTGNRRWWTIAVRGLNFQHNIDMQQLYAQLALDLERGEQFWLTQEERRSLADYNQRHRHVSAITERILDHLDPDMAGQPGGTATTAIELLRDIGINHPTNAQCKECGSVLRDVYGSPRRINGRDKWRVHVRQCSNPYGQSEPEEEF